MSVKLLTEHHLEFLSLKGGCTGSSESTLVKMPHCWKSHVTAQMYFRFKLILNKNDNNEQNLRNKTKKTKSEKKGESKTVISIQAFQAYRHKHLTIIILTLTL